MIYKAIGLMSGSSLDGLDIVFTEIQESSGKWTYRILHAECTAYSDDWRERLAHATQLPAEAYQLLHVDYGRFLGEKVNAFIAQHHLQHQVNLVASHGHTTFHDPKNKMTHQLGDGASLAAVTQLPVVSDLRSMDVAFDGQGAPIVPLGEKLLFEEYNTFLNIGGIANVSVKEPDQIIAFDVCPANRVLNLLASLKNLAYDNGGQLAASGKVHDGLLHQLNGFSYYRQRPPKSLANKFGTAEIYPMILHHKLPVADALCTFTEHIAIQISQALAPFAKEEKQKMMITGGGAFNDFLVSRISHHLAAIRYEVFIPEKEVVEYKEALIMALLGVLRWREQYTVMSSVTGARRNSIGGALWLGTEA